MKNTNVALGIAGIGLVLALGACGRNDEAGSAKAGPNEGEIVAESKPAPPPPTPEVLPPLHGPALPPNYFLPPPSQPSPRPAPPAPSRPLQPAMGSEEYWRTRPPGAYTQSLRQQFGDWLNEGIKRERDRFPFGGR